MDASFYLDRKGFAEWLRAANLSRRRISDYTGISRTSFRRWEQEQVAMSRKSAARLTMEVGMPRNLLAPTSR